ncbi:MAG: hypothetical protein H6Q77_613 [Gemmatimonadetes bacterium]|nr:hypothetical protein [Gemmatimonadota bacterium]
MTRTSILLTALLLAGFAGEARAQTPVRPGMTADEVTAAWGAPSATRARGEFTYMNYPSSCMPACGTQDVVILQNGKVVDAIARSSNHPYDGSSSLSGKAPGFTDAAGVTTPASPPPSPSGGKP